MEQNTEKIRQVKGNRIAVVIDGLVARFDDPSLREQYKQKICTELNITNRYRMLLNNNAQPTVGELALVAQILGVTTDELIQFEPA